MATAVSAPGPSRSSPAGRVDWRRLGIRFAIELGPALVFALALQVASLAWATGLFMLAVVAATAVSWARQRRLPVIPLALTATAIVLGALTIAFGEAAFIQVRATLVNGLAAAAILAGLARGRLVLKGALQEGFRLPDRAWRRLSLFAAAYLASLAVLNEVVRHAFPVETWAWFKAAIPFLNAAFLAATWPMLRREVKAPADEAAR